MIESGFGRTDRPGLGKVGPQTRASIKQEAGKQTFDPALAAKVVQANTGRSNLTAGDIEILTFLVLMEASRSAREDLKAIMDGVKQIDAAKGRLRQTPQTSARSNSVAGNATASRQTSSAQATRVTPAPDRSAIRPFPLPKAELDKKIDRVKNDPDSLNEMGEMESLRLQMAMDRMSKMMTTLSNVMKKISDTQAALTQNLK